MRWNSVSVPLRGSVRGKPISIRHERPDHILFPSPCGEVLEERIEISSTPMEWKKFPSPCGEVLEERGGALNPLAQL